MNGSSLLPIVALSDEQGKTGLWHLKRFWNKGLLKARNELPDDAFMEEWSLDNALLSVIGVGVYQFSRYLYENQPSFEEFEDWILNLNQQKLDSDRVHRFNNLFLENAGFVGAELQETYLLTEAEWGFWNKNGYLIIPGAVAQESCQKAVQIICEFLGVNLADKSTWYKSHDALQGIMVQLFQHPVLQKNRESPKVRAVYEQLWGRKDLWLNTDKVGFNPPETENYSFRGSPLHWDTSLELPIPFGLQGLLYLTDTTAKQGAFTCVPGFHNIIEQWLENLHPDTDPRSVDLTSFNPEPIVANAGDFIVWHHALPHGASPNTAASPRFVQYVNYDAVNLNDNRAWK